jgi:hypothetical protein
VELPATDEIGASVVMTKTTTTRERKDEPMKLTTTALVSADGAAP